jgi:ubiquinone/menaquinone biosynthesis C-methylase UbiE
VRWTARSGTARTLYRGTAECYDRFRPRYLATLVDDLRARVHFDDAGRVLDLACGTGQVAFALAGDVAASSSQWLSGGASSRSDVLAEA